MAVNIEDVLTYEKKLDEAGVLQTVGNAIGSGIKSLFTGKPGNIKQNFQQAQAKSDVKNVGKEANQAGSNLQNRNQNISEELGAQLTGLHQALGSMIQNPKMLQNQVGQQKANTQQAKKDNKAEVKAQTQGKQQKEDLEAAQTENEQTKNANATPQGEQS